MIYNNEDQQLDEWLKRGPEWVRQAYNNDAAVNRVMKHCAIAGDSTEGMLWRLAGIMYEQKNHWEATAMDQAMRSPLPPLGIPSANPTPNESIT